HHYRIFFNDTPNTAIHTLSLHDALPISQNFTYSAMRKQVEDSLKHLQLDQLFLEQLHCIPTEEMRSGKVFDHLRKLKDEKLIQRSEEHTSELQSQSNLVCRLLLEKKKKQ